LAVLPKRGARLAAPVWRALLRTRAKVSGEDRAADDHALEASVDIHAFSPRELASLARRAGFGDVQVRGEELVANWFGWFNHALESDGEFGIVWLSDDGLRHVGCAARIEQVLERMDDGRMNILVRGTRPFRVLERQAHLAYPAGVIEFVEDRDEGLDDELA